MTVLDIGANIGYFSIVAGKVVGDSGKVFAFEPYPSTFEFLNKNIKTNGLKNIVAVKKAVSNRAGVQRLYLANDPGEHSLGGRDGVKSIDVEITTVDEFMWGKKVDFIKMDVEGAEFHVLMGMTETIKNNPNIKIITEFGVDHLKRNGSSPSLFLETLMNCGFTLYAIDENNHLRTPITTENMRGLSFTNIYCTIS